MRILRRYFPFLFIPTAIALAVIFIDGCSSTTSVSSNDGTVTMQSQLATSDVDGMVYSKGDVPSDVTFDKIVVTRVRIFIKDIKLHWDKDDLTKDDHDGTIKTGPFILQFDSSGSHVVASSVIPAGTYDRIKFEIHKPNTGDADDVALLQQYPDFQNGNKGYTVLIDGYTVKNGVRTYFSSRSDKTKNFELKFEDKGGTEMNGITLGGNSSQTLAFEFDPRKLFHLEGLIFGTVFDPRDGGHQQDIDDHIEVAIRVFRVS